VSFAPVASVSWLDYESLLCCFHLALDPDSFTLEFPSYLLVEGLATSVLAGPCVFPFRLDTFAGLFLFRPSRTRAFWGGVWRPASTQARTPTACCRTLFACLAVYSVVTDGCPSHQADFDSAPACY
jgi:hypothetical protein